MLKQIEHNRNTWLLYLDTRELPSERMAEVRAALDQGYKLVVATPNPSAYRGYGVHKLILTQVGQYDDAEREILDALDKDRITVSGIVAWKDREVVLAARLGAKLKLPCTTLEAVERVRNKSLTRKCLQNVGTVNPRYAEIRNEQDFIAALKTVGLPALLKPAGNSGSRGIKRVASIETAIDTYRDFIAYNAQQAGEMFHYYEDVALLEQELTGSEHSMAGLVSNGQVITLGIADKRFDRSLPLQYQNIVPSQLAASLQDEIVMLVQQAVQATGIDHCGFHVDFMVTDEGVKILEIGGRLGGEMINSHLIPLAQPGLLPYQAVLEVVQGRNPLSQTDYTRTFSGRAGSRVVVAPNLGVIGHVSGVEKVRRDSHCRDFMQLYGPGDEMVLPEIKFKAYELGYIVAQADQDEDLDGLLDELAGRVQMVVNN